MDDDATPPLGVKLSYYRLINVSTLFSIGIIKAVLAYKGQSTVPTTLDWVGGTLLAAVLYWIGLYEQRDDLEWFFQVDLAPAIGYCTKRFVGGVIWSLFSLDGAPLFTFSLYYPGVILGPYILDIYVSHDLGSHPGLELALALAIYFCCVLLWFCFRVLPRRVRALVWVWQCAMRFLDVYGPGAPVAPRYGWFGAVGRVMGIVCGIALVVLPFALAFRR